MTTPADDAAMGLKRLRGRLSEPAAPVVGGAAASSCRYMLDAVGAASLKDIGGLRACPATLIQSGNQWVTL